MSEKFYTILTNIGKSKVANFAINGEEVKFVKLKVGDGNGKYYNPIENQKDLINTVWEGKIGNIQIDKENPNWIILEAIIPPEVGDFTIREYGAFDEEDNLLAISKCPETYKPTISNGSTKELIIKMILSVSNTESISFEVDPNIMLAKKSKVDEIDKKVNHTISQLKDLTKNITKIINDGNYTFKDDIDLNTLTEQGNYYVSVKCTNSPGNGLLEVKNFGNGEVIKQILYRLGTLNYTDADTYIRTCFKGIWSNWSLIGGNNTGWIDLPLTDGISSIQGYTCRYRKVGKIVQLCGIISGITTETQSDKVIATLPSGFRPSEINIVLLPKSTNDDNYLKIYVSANGAIGTKGTNMRSIASSNGFMLSPIMFLVN
ncbi:phage tail protein [Clostridium sp. CMCC3677]|uniref:phage tail-collar fiber domain-containing protein n=1 Tax=Clostridium sp. CMCC3677 TaxID=2949963 RepID=UPI0013F01841|nr:phage tail protein [Clostridium sp. CMCC3677]NFG60529.1 hypothetical protein [Clostridium botulinum]NFQ09828.1 hypothetical protein [Clostridium botulinum]